MCIIFFAFGGSQHKLILAANRDESIRRPTKSAHFWEHADHVLGGLDLGFKTAFSKPLMMDDEDKKEWTSGSDGERSRQGSASLSAMGTWLGLTKDGRFSFVTNFREHPSNISPDALSRGLLVKNFLVAEGKSPEDYAKSIAANRHLYNGFNLVVGDVFGEVWFIGNRDPSRTDAIKLEPGMLYAITNGTLEGGETWPKALHGKRLVQTLLDDNVKDDELIERLLTVLRDATLFADDQLPPNYSLELERLCAPICIHQERSTFEYGTRTHSVIVVDADSKARFVEVDRYQEKEEGEGEGEDVVCPWAYIASNKIETLAKAHNATIIWTPVLLGGVYKLTQAPQGKDGSATDVMAANKKDLHTRDFARTISRSPVPLKWHPSHPVRSVSALRLLYALDQEDRRKLSHALYKAYWVDNVDVSDKDVLLSIASRVVDPKKFKHPLNASIFAHEELSSNLTKSTERVVELGGPGVPCFLVNNKLFWGQDRLHFVASELAGIKVPQHRLKPISPLTSPRTIKFFWDVSSPWSYIGWTQVRRLEIEAGPLLTIEHYPILVGALFKEIGTPNVPMLVMSPVKRQYLAKDMNDWTEYWTGLRYSDGSLPRKVEINFPSVFPIRSVVPSRVILVEPKTADAIFTSAWEKDVEIADPAKLQKVLDAAGFNGADLIKRSSEQHIKDKLRANNELASQLKLCGVPSYVVDDEVFWGQDRLDVLMDTVHSGAFAAKM
ncbi:hypothetical protein HDU97_000058 [Phlyctochytrium planicorne]|nr:hypothetical protein HDU97_000058 [Phlyctochytrium planicorne]